MPEQDASDREDAISDAEQDVTNVRFLLSDFGDVSLEEKHGAIKHALAELRNARRKLPDDY